MRIDKALIHLKENDLKADNEYMFGVMYQKNDELKDDLFSLIKLTYEKDDDGDWWVAHLTQGYLTSSNGEQFMAGGENIDELLGELFTEFGRYDFDFANEEIDKLVKINYKVYQLDEDITDLITEYALYALFPDLPNALVSDKKIPSEEDIAKFKNKVKEKINIINKSLQP